MIKPDILCVHPLHLEYPVWEWNMARFKDYFNSIWVVFSNHHIPNQDMSNFVRQRLPFVHFLTASGKDHDWRNGATNEALDAMPKEGHVLFLEEDFLIHDHTFFDKVFKNDLDFIYFKEDERVHPAFSVVKRELIDKTSRNFAVYPPGDHFYKFFQELPEGVNIETLGVKKREDFYHMAGLSQCYQNFKYDEPFYHPINFLYYNFKSLQFKDQHPLFLQLQQQIERRFGHTQTHTFLDRFFPI